MAEGEGQLRCRDGTVYTGDWRKGRQHGKGTLVFRDKVLYLNKVAIHKEDKDKSLNTGHSVQEGESETFKLDDKGTFKVRELYTYKGEFVNNEFEGKGVLSF